MLFTIPAAAAAAEEEEEEEEGEVVEEEVPSDSPDNSVKADKVEPL